MYNVLLVDDEARIISSLKNIIPWKEYGFRLVDTACNGSEALEKLNNQQQIDLVITDIKMPKMDGIQLIEKCSILYPNIKFIILSAHDEFEYVKKGLLYDVENYILKPINKNELIETLIKIEEKNSSEKHSLFSELEFNSFKENLLKRWIHGSIEGFEFEERAKYTNLPINYNEYCIAVIKTFKSKNINRYTDSNYSSSDSEKIIFQTLNKFNNDNMIFKDTNGNYTILFYSNSQTGIKSEKLKSFLNTIVANLKKIDVKTFITIGSLIKDYMNISKSYHECLSLLDYSLFMYKNQVISISDITYNGKEGTIYTPVCTKLNDFTKSVSELDTDSACEFIYTVFNKQLSENIYDLNYTKKIIQEILLQLSGVLKNEATNNLEIPEDLDNLFEKYNQIQSSANFIEYLISVTVNTIDYLSKTRNEKSPIVNLVINYIKCNYNDTNLSLKTISNKFNVNASYLGQLFKNETGTLFSGYLNNFRVSMAKLLISDNKMRLVDIAKKTGYANQSYFQKVFKKTVGISPSEYKRYLKK